MLFFSIKNYAVSNIGIRKIHTSHKQGILRQIISPCYTNIDKDFKSKNIVHSTALLLKKRIIKY